MTTAVREGRRISEPTARAEGSPPVPPAAEALVRGLHAEAAADDLLHDLGVTYPAAMRSSRIRCTHALMSARCEKTWGKFPKCQPSCGSISRAYSSGLAQAGSFSHSALGRGSPPPDLGERRDQP